MIHGNGCLGVFSVNFGEGVFSRKDGYLLFKAFDSGEQFENHKKHQNEAGEYDGIDVSLDPDDVSENVTEVRKKNDSSHTTPHHESDTKFEDGLMILSFKIVIYTLVEHESGDDEDDDLVELKVTEVHKKCWLIRKRD